jgi:Xaa-Pro aminopeptidase
VAAAEGTRTLACQSDHFTVTRQNYLHGWLKEIKSNFVWHLMAHSRVRKDDHEVGLLRKAVKIQQDALEATLEQVGKRLKKGVKTLERDLAAILEFEMKTRGSSQPSFETIVASGATGSLPHYRPKDRPIKPGVPVLIDWGATYQGYHSDMTRTICFGKWPKEIQKIYEIVREAYSLAAAAIRPGMTGKELDAIARNHIASKGYGPQFGHSLGHGIGLEIHENPRISPMSTTELAPGMVITIEPGIYLPGVGGVRLEDDYLVTDKGGENLCSLPMDLKWATW